MVIKRITITPKAAKKKINVSAFVRQSVQTTVQDDLVTEFRHSTNGTATDEQVNVCDKTVYEMYINSSE